MKRRGWMTRFLIGHRSYYILWSEWEYNWWKLVCKLPSQGRSNMIAALLFQRKLCSIKQPQTLKTSISNGSRWFINCTKRLSGPIVCQWNVPRFIGKRIDEVWAGTQDILCRWKNEKECGREVLSIQRVHLLIMKHIRPGTGCHVWHHSSGASSGWCACWS